MTCRERQARIVEWILEELPVAEAQELESHVEQCQECARALAGVRGVEQTLKQHFSDREMPARLVFLAEKPQGFAAGWWTSLARTAAMATAAAVVFAAVLVGAYSVWGDRLPRRAQAAPSRAEVEILVAQAAEKNRAQQREELAVALRQEQVRDLAVVARQLSYLQAAQTVVWQENQQQNALMELLARNSLQGEVPPAGKP